MRVYVLFHSDEASEFVDVFSSRGAAEASIVAPHGDWCCGVEEREAREDPLPPEPLWHGPWLPTQGSHLMPAGFDDAVYQQFIRTFPAWQWGKR